MAGVAVRIQIWAPGLDPSPLVQGLSQAQLSPQVLADPAAVLPDQPLLLAYGDPLAWWGAAEPSAPAAGAASLLAALPALVASGVSCRLVNLSCLALSVLVAWCVDPASQPPMERAARFPEADPFEALLAITWLERHPQALRAYQELEGHPRAAPLDGRAPDRACLERYRQAASLQALQAARQERLALEADLQDLAAQLEPLQDQQLETLALREQVLRLQSRLQEADALQARCSELQLSLQAQQLDLEQMARRLALLERLVEEGSHASVRLQHRLGQALA
jgi:hypothetical protein